MYLPSGFSGCLRWRETVQLIACFRLTKHSSRHVVTLRALAYTVGMVIATVRQYVCFTLLVATAVISSSAPALADDAAVTETAKNYLRSSMVVLRDGSHNVAMKALRHLRDPELRPFLLRWTKTNHPAMRINGILGLAELDPNGLTLEQIAAVEDPAVQSQIITAAMDDGLISLEETKKLLTWQDINDGVKLVVILRQDRPTRAAYIDLIRNGAQSDLMGRRGMSGLMLADLGDPMGAKVLEEINNASNVDRELVQEQMLTVLANVDLKDTSNWALSVAKNAKDDPRLELMALREALRQGSDAAREYWYERFRSSTEPADRTRLGIIALESAGRQPGKLFDPLITSDDPLLAQMGRAGAAVSNQQPDTAEQLVRLIELDHSIANAWALKYVSTKAAAQVRNVVLLALILTAEQGDPRGMQRRLDLAVAAAQEMVEADPIAAKQMLQPIIQDRKTDPMVLQALLYGVLRANGQNIYQVVDGMQPIRNADGRNLILLLKARDPKRMNDRDIRNLGFVVQGAGTMPPTFRLQAAWNYLKATGQAQAVLNQILEEQGVQ